MDPEFLTIDDVLFIHADQIKRYGGSPDLRDRGLLHSAVETPQAMFGGAYLHPDLIEMAAAYLFHIVQNHPFVDGNKRAGTAAAMVFLDLNGIETDIDEDELAELVISVASGTVNKAGVNVFLRERVRGD